MRYAWSAHIDAAWPRFLLKLHAPDALACWTWQGARSSGQGNTAPYGSFSVAGIGVRAHIFAAEAAGLPSAETRDHLCGNTLCVNPAHLDPCSRSENSRRRWHGIGRAA